MQVGSFSTSNLSYGTALQQDFVICKVELKHLMTNFLAIVHFAFFFSSAVIKTEINGTDHKSITARHFPRDNQLVEAEIL